MFFIRIPRAADASYGNLSHDRDPEHPRRETPALLGTFLKLSVANLIRVNLEFGNMGKFGEL